MFYNSTGAWSWGITKVEISRDITFDEKIAFKKYIENSIDSNDEEEHEYPKEESKCSPEHPSEEQPTT
jgi:hypothetical protein